MFPGDGSPINFCSYHADPRHHLQPATAECCLTTHSIRSCFQNITRGKFELTLLPFDLFVALMLHYLVHCAELSE